MLHCLSNTKFQTKSSTYSEIYVERSVNQRISPTFKARDIEIKRELLVYLLKIDMRWENLSTLERAYFIPLSSWIWPKVFEVDGCFLFLTFPISSWPHSPNGFMPLLWLSIRWIWLPDGVIWLLAYQLVKLLDDYFADQLIDWLIDWLIGWLVDWVIDCLIDWLIDWLIHRFVDWLIDSLVDWLADWLIDWFISWLLGWLIWQSIGQHLMNLLVCAVVLSSRE